LQSEWQGAPSRPTIKTVPTLTIRWQTAEQKWTHEVDDRTFVFQQGQSEWTKALGVVTVPNDVGRLVILLNVAGQVADADVCWFDKLGLYRIK